MEIIKAGRVYGLGDSETGVKDQIVRFAEGNYPGTTDEVVLDIMIDRMQQGHRKTGDMKKYLAMLHLQAAYDMLKG